MRFRIAILLVLGVGMMLVIVVSAPTINDFALNKRVYVTYNSGEGRLVGWFTVRRWHDSEALSGRLDLWYGATGYKARERRLLNGKYVLTNWHSDGRVKEQWSYRDEERIKSPPWLLEKTDLAVPTAPWVEEGVSIDSWWAIAEPKHAN